MIKHFISKVIFILKRLFNRGRKRNKSRKSRTSDIEIFASELTTATTSPKRTRGESDLVAVSQFERRELTKPKNSAQLQSQVQSHRAQFERRGVYKKAR